MFDLRKAYKRVDSSMELYMFPIKQTPVEMGIELEVEWYHAPTKEFSSKVNRIFVHNNRFCEWESYDIFSEYNTGITLTKSKA